jgi:hypothetical protein
MIGLDALKNAPPAALLLNHSATLANSIANGSWLTYMIGNDLAIQACREGKVPFPDGAIIAALHYRHVPSEENNKVFGQAQSFVRMALRASPNMRTC